MKLKYSIVGALLGSVVGFAAAVLAVAISDGSVGFSILYFGPIGLLVGAFLGVLVSLTVLPYVHGDAGANWQPRKKTWLVLGFTCGAPLLAVGMFAWSFHITGPPSREELIGKYKHDQSVAINNFQQHHATFVSLARMIETDKGKISVDNRKIDPAQPYCVRLAPSRLQEYQNVLKSMGMSQDIQPTDTAGELALQYRVPGSVLPYNAAIDYAYCTRSPSHLLRRLDDFQVYNNNLVVTYTHIEGNWYLCYDYAPED